MSRYLGILGFVVMVVGLQMAGEADACGCGYGWSPYGYQWVYSPSYAYSQDDVPYYVANPPFHYGWSILRPLQRPQYTCDTSSSQPAASPAPPSPPLRLVNPYVTGKVSAAPATTQLTVAPLRIKNPFVQ